MQATSGTGSAYFNDKPWNTIAALVAVQILCWTLAPLLSSDAPPLDVVENTIWGTERILASYKNPALSSLMLEAARVVTGGIGWPAYILSQICIGLTFVCVFQLGREPMGDARALAGTLLLTACYYFGWHSPEFNQDIVEMPFWAAAALALWRATERNSILWWMILGATGAASLYGKLSAAVMLAAAASWILFDSKARSRLLTAGPWIALAAFAAVATPLANWLLHGGLATIKDYAVMRGKGHSAGAAKWLVLQSVMLLPMTFMAWLCGLIPAPTAKTSTPDESRFTRFLVWMTAVPILLTAVATIVEHTGAKLMWGVPMLNLTGLLLMTFAPRQLSQSMLRRLAASAFSIIAVLSSASAVDTYYRPQFTKEPARQNWPHAAIAQRFREIWRTETGSPLRIVAGDPMNWVGGLVALWPGDIASVFTAADYNRSPWITPERLARDGVLIVWPAKAKGLPAEFAAIAGNAVPRYEVFPLPRPGKAKAVEIGYVIIPPAK